MTKPVAQTKTPVYIIAEAGVNHNGNDDLAFKLVDVAVEAGADAVKFQTFKADRVVTKKAVKANYQKQTTDSTESQFDMLKKLELSHEMHHKLVAYCNNKGIEFLSTAFDEESLNFLVEDLGLKTLKIPSGEITNGPLLLAYARTRCDLILSTGMATLGEIEDALSVLAFGLSNDTTSSISPSRAAFQTVFCSNEGQKKLKEKVIILHCTTEYPTPLDEINLNALSTIHNAFRVKTGYSDHSKGISVSIAAVALGAVIIEKHFTLDKTLPGPDHQASLDPGELKDMVIAIRGIERAMGDGVKRVMPSELKNKTIARRSMIVNESIKKGEILTKENISIVRPGGGRSPMEYWDTIDKIQLSDLSQGHRI